MKPVALQSIYGVRPDQRRKPARWQGFQKGREPYKTEPVSFEIDIVMEGSASTQERIELIEAAKKGCFVEQTLIRPNTVGHRLRVNNDWVRV